MSRQLPDLILDALSAGPVGVGDPIGDIDVANLKHTMRADSVLLKPDVPIVPVDAMYQSDAANLDSPMVAATHSGNEVEVFAYPREAAEMRAVVPLSDLGISGPAYLWDWVRQIGNLVPAGGSVPLVFKNGWAYAVLTPVSANGIAVMGDLSKIVPLAAKRFLVVKNGKELKIRVIYADGEETVTVTGYAQRRPIVRPERGSAGPLEYDAGTHMFHIAVHPYGRMAEIVVKQSGSSEDKSKTSERPYAQSPIQPRDFQSQ